MASRYASRPEHVFIGNHTYSIEWLTTDEWQARDFDMGKDGLTYAHVSQIFIRLIQGRREALYQEVVLHEVTHAIWDTTGFSLDPHWHKAGEDNNDLEEHVILFQSPMLLFVLKHNPDLVKWLLADGNDAR